MVADHPQGVEALDTEVGPRSVGEVFAAIEQLAAVQIPDLAVVLSPDVQGMALLLAALRRAMAQLRWAADELEDEITKAMPGKEVEVPGLGKIEMRTGSSRKGWDKDALTRTMIHTIAADYSPTALVDPISGEEVDVHHFVEHVITLWCDAATPSWKSTGLRQFKIDPDEYCEVTWGRKTITMPLTEMWSGSDDTPTP